MACRRRRRDLQGAQRRNSENPFSRHIISFPNCLYGRQAMPLALLWFLLALKARKKPNEPGRAWLLVPKAGLEPARCCQQRILSPSRLPFHHTGKLLIYYTPLFQKLQEVFAHFFHFYQKGGRKSPPPFLQTVKNAYFPCVYSSRWTGTPPHIGTCTSPCTSGRRYSSICSVTSLPCGWMQLSGTFFSRFATSAMSVVP